MATAGTRRCVSCGAEVAGHYCGQCGEAAAAHDYSLGHFAEEALETFAHVDGRVFSSFRALLTRPGLLSADFLRGRRKTQMGPLQLFVICNVVYFLVQPFTLVVPFTSTLRIQTTMRAWSAMARRVTDEKIASTRLSREEYQREFDHTAHLQGKSLVIIMVPLFALGAWAAYGRARRFYAEHLVFSFYLYAFMMIWMAFGTLALTWPIAFAIHHGLGDFVEGPVSVALTAPVVLYLFLAVRRAYGGNWLESTVKTLLLAGWMVTVLTAYRFILFFTTYYAT
jgi:hypothetical protein